MIGSMNDEILNVEELAIDTIKYIYSEYCDNVIERYGLDKEKTAASCQVKMLSIQIIQ